MNRCVHAGVLVVLAAELASAESIRFTVTADSRGDGEHISLLQSVLSLPGGPGAFIITPGDMAPLVTTQSQIEAVFGVDFPWIPVVGNHEMDEEADIAFLRAYYWERLHGFPYGAWGGLFSFANAGPPGNVEMTYSFDVGPVHIVVLNEYWNGGTQPGDDEGVVARVVPELSAWLAADLLATDRTFKLVFGHEPAYPRPDVHFGDTRHLIDSLNLFATDRDLFWAVMETGGVHAYIHGHTHRFTHYRPVGSRVWQTGPSQARGLGKYDGFYVIEIDEQNMTVEAYRSFDSDQVQHVATFTLAVTRPLPYATVCFQQGVAGYAGTVDTTLFEADPDNDCAGCDLLTVDTMAVIWPPESEAQALVRFDGIVGDGPNQVPPSAAVRRARLRFYTVDSTWNNDVRFHRMVRPWQDTDTWNSLDEGVAADGTEAVACADRILPWDLRENCYHTLDVTESVRTWIERGEPNRGWALLPTGADGWACNSAEGLVPPELCVEYEGASFDQVAHFRQGDAANYSGTVDTKLREHEPDTSYSTHAEISVDTEEPDGSGHASICLLRFENIVGDGPGQVPPGAQIVSASVRIYTTNSSSDLFGGAGNIRWHRMLTPWQDTDTWNSLGGGVSDDDVEATRFIEGVIQSDLLGEVFHWADVTPSLKAWVEHGAPNYGWALLPTGDDDWGFYASEGAMPPELRVAYRLVVPADCDGDGDVDLDDYGAFAGCMTGPAGEAGSDCDCADLDRSGAVDLLDFAGFGIRFAGP